MSEQHTPPPGDLRTWLSEMGPDVYALAWVAPESDPAEWATPAPTLGETGVARPGADLTRVTVEETTEGIQETLRRWLHLDDGRRQLAIISTDLGSLREHTPGELTAQLLHDPANDEAQVTSQLASWLYRRNTEAPQDLEVGWITAAAAWTCHMHAHSSYPPPSVLSACLASAGEQERATEELVIRTGLKVADLVDRLERTYHRSELVEAWHNAESLAGGVPALQDLADWLLDQVALRDADAQQLRAVLEPDITDHLRDRRSDRHLVPALDEVRTRHLAQARQTVRAYTAASYAGREQEAEQILGAFPIPARRLRPSGPATSWRQSSATAQDAVEALAAQRAAATHENADYFADPERLHAAASYLAAREAQLHLEHDALGRLATPVLVPPDLPGDLFEVAAGRPQQRLSEAFGSPERARQVLDGRIAYLQQQPVPAYRREETSAELALLQAVRHTLDPQPTGTAHIPLDGGAVARRVKQIMSAPRAEPSWRPPSAGERERRNEAQPHSPESGPREAWVITAHDGRQGVRP